MTMAPTTDAMRAFGDMPSQAACTRPIGVRGAWRRAPGSAVLASGAPGAMEGSTLPKERPGAKGGLGEVAKEGDAPGWEAVGEDAEGKRAAPWRWTGPEAEAWGRWGG